MSGFGGIVHLDGARDFPAEDRKRVERMASRLAFRGPDGAQVWSENGASFCFTLLRTGPAPQEETQPCTLDGCAWLLGDVRLEDRDALIRDLQGQGKDCSQATTDEKLTLHAWQTWGGAGTGERFREVLRGEFGFALWCVEEKRLHCFRDLVGSRPFFFYEKGDMLCFSNTLEALLEAPGISDQPDYRYLGDYLLTSGCGDPERTAYREIRRLPGGHEFTFSREGSQVRRFASLPIEEPLKLKRPEDYVEQYKTVLREAVEERLPRSSAVVFLSGGLDSSTVAATANQILRNNNAGSALYAHTLDCRPLFDDRESDYAAKVARHLGIPIEISHCGDCTPFSGWDSSQVALPEPRNDPFLLLSVQRYERAVRQARVVLSGDGGDDILGGKAWPYLMHLLRGFRIRTLLGSFGGYILRHGKIPPFGAGIQTRLRRWFGVRQEVLEYPNWLNPEFERAYALRERWRELQIPPKAEHPLHPGGHAGLSGPFWPNLLEQEDAAWSGAAVEYRAPMLDTRVLKFLLRLPPVPWCMDKELLRRATKGLLPEEIRRRRKTPVQEEPLLLHITQRKWSPLPLPTPSSRLLELVNWEKWTATLTKLEEPQVWSQLCPLSLNLWLKRIETRDRIQ